MYLCKKQSSAHLRVGSKVLELDFLFHLEADLRKQTAEQVAHGYAAHSDQMFPDELRHEHLDGEAEHLVRRH